MRWIQARLQVTNAHIEKQINNRLAHSRSTSSTHSRSRSGHSRSDHRCGDRAGGQLEPIREEEVEQNAVQPPNLPINVNANQLINNNMNNDRQCDNNDNRRHSGRGGADNGGRLERQCDLRDALRDLHQNHDICADHNNRHNERDEYELRRRAEYDHDYGAPMLNHDVELEDRRRQEEEMRCRADYDRVHGAPEHA